MDERIFKCEEMKYLEKLVKENPNDYDLGSKVRSLFNTFPVEIAIDMLNSSEYNLIEEDKREIRDLISRGTPYNIIVNELEFDREIVDQVYEENYPSVEGEI